MPQAPSVARGLPFVEGTVAPWPLKRLAGESAGASTRLKRLANLRRWCLSEHQAAGHRGLDKARTRGI